MQRTPRIVSKFPFFYGWVIVGVAGLNNFGGNIFGLGTLSVFIKPIGDEFGWSRTVLSGAINVGIVTVILLSPLAGWFVDRYGPRIVLTASSAVVGLAAIGLSQVNGPLTFYLALGTGRGLFSGAISVATIAAVANWFIRRRGRAMSIYMIAPSFSFIVLPLVSQALIVQWGWKTAWVSLGLMVWGLAVLPSYFMLIRRPEDVGQLPDGGPVSTVTPPKRSRNPYGATQEPQWTLREAIRTQTFWLVTVATSLLSLCLGGVQLHLVAYLISRGLSSTVGSMAISIVGGGMAIGTLLWGYLSDRFSTKSVFTVVSTCFTGVIVLLLLISSVPMAMSVSVLLGVCLGGILVMQSLAYANYFGRPSLGAIRGIAHSFQVMGQAVGILMAGIIFDTTGSYTAAVVTFAALSMVAVVFTMLAQVPVKREP